MTTEQLFIEREHALLVHSDGSECLDGCDERAQWCRCDRPWQSHRKCGWIVCGRCGRAVN